MNQYSKTKCVWAKWFFGYWKRYLKTTYLENFSHRGPVDHEIRPPRFLHFLNDPKKFFGKFLFFTQNHPIRVKTCFHDFRKFFVSKCPRLGHFSTKIWNFRFSRFYQVWCLWMTWYGQEVKKTQSQRSQKVKEVRSHWSWAGSTGRYSSQLQLRSGFYMFLVCPSVRPQKLQRTAHRIS